MSQLKFVAENVLVSECKLNARNSALHLALWDCVWIY